MSKTEPKLYSIWGKMLHRCFNEDDASYRHYGGRGVSVCDEWKNSFQAFVEWAYQNGFDPLLGRKECSIDRIDVNGDYCPQNCRWTDMKTQANNKTTTRYLTANGETHSVSEWSDITGINYCTILKRIDLAGMSVEDALNTPVHEIVPDNARLITFNGATKTLGTWAKELGMERQALVARLNDGWSVERALTTPLKMYQERDTDFTGQHIGRCTVLRELDPKYFVNGRKHRRFLCLCDCGKEFEVGYDALKRPASKYSPSCHHCRNHWPKITVCKEIVT